MNNPLKILYFVTEDWYFCSHRLPLALAAKKAGYDVVVVTRVNKHGELIRSHGLKLINLEISRQSRNPFKELGVIWRLFNIYREEKPNIAHHVALKPVLYGAVAARLACVPAVVSALAGLGFLFVSKHRKARLLRPMVEIAFRLLLNHPNNRVILQNPDDMYLLTSRAILSSESTILIRGSGVDTMQFQVTCEPDGIPLVLLASRMLWDKGIGDFVEAARKLKQKDVVARFVLVGEGDSQNPNSISNYQLERWQQEGAVEWWGRQVDMPAVFANSHVACLPSAYGEGVPKVLIEAASCGRPIVTTDAPGCREIVRNGKNGLLVPVGDASALEYALRQLIENASLRKTMGKYGRTVVEQEFSIEIVVRQTLFLYNELIQQ
jgi:glycosyltransferase involved in cell wall biosynthesis